MDSTRLGSCDAHHTIVQVVIITSSNKISRSRCNIFPQTTGLVPVLIMAEASSRRRLQGVLDLPKEITIRVTADHFHKKEWVLCAFKHNRRMRSNKHYMRSSEVGLSFWSKEEAERQASRDAFARALLDGPLKAQATRRNTLLKRPAPEPSVDEWILRATKSGRVDTRVYNGGHDTSTFLTLQHSHKGIFRSHLTRIAEGVSKVPFTEVDVCKYSKAYRNSHSSGRTGQKIKYTRGSTTATLIFGRSYVLQSSDSIITRE